MVRIRLGLLFFLGICFFFGPRVLAQGGHHNMENMVMLSPKQIELAQIKSTLLEKHHLFKEVRAAGEVAFDSEMQVAQQEYFSSQGQNKELVLDRLKLLGISEGELKRGQVDEALIFPKERAWVYVHIYEYEIEGIKIGQRADINSSPSINLKGFVRAIVPVLEEKTRTYKVRVEVPQAQNKLNSYRYVNAYIRSELGFQAALPKTAVLITGNEQIVYIDKTNGHYEKRGVKIGSLAYALIKNQKYPYYPVYGGIKEGERVVTSANFLIDSQSEISGPGMPQHVH